MGYQEVAVEQDLVTIPDQAVAKFDIFDGGTCVVFAEPTMLLEDVTADRATADGKARAELRLKSSRRPEWASTKPPKQASTLDKTNS